MKVVHSEFDYSFLECEIGDHLPSFVIIKVNDFTKTYRLEKDLESKLDRAINVINTMKDVMQDVSEMLEPIDDLTHVQRVKSHLEIFKDFNIEKEVLKRS